MLLACARTGVALLLAPEGVPALKTSHGGFRTPSLAPEGVLKAVLNSLGPLGIELDDEGNHGLEPGASRVFGSLSKAWERSQPRATFPWSLTLKCGSLWLGSLGWGLGARDAKEDQGLAAICAYWMPNSELQSGRLSQLEPRQTASQWGMRRPKGSFWCGTVLAADKREGLQVSGRSRVECGCCNYYPEDQQLGEAIASSACPSTECPFCCVDGLGCTSEVFDVRVLLVKCLQALFG